MAGIVLCGLGGSIQGRTWESSDHLRIGRLEALEVVISESSVSRYHAEIRWRERGWWIRDLGSTHGTFSNGVRLGNGYWPLREKDYLQIGQVAILVLLLTPVPTIVESLETLTSSRTRQEGIAALQQILLGPRKLRLLAAACFRSHWRDFAVESTCLAERYVDGLATEEEFRSIFPVGHPLVGQLLDQVALAEALDVAERYADGLGTDEELASARRRFNSLAADQTLEESRQCPLEPIRGMADVAFTHGPIECDDFFKDDQYQIYLAHRPEDAMDGQTDYFGDAPSIWRAMYVRILADMVSTLPVASLRVDPSWLTANDGVVGKMTQSIYEDRSFADMPILADALEDAGCTEEAILRHCREPGDHWRGCWVIDLLRGVKDVAEPRRAERVMPPTTPISDDDRERQYAGVIPCPADVVNEAVHRIRIEEAGSARAWESNYLRVGRSPEADLRLTNESGSRRHADIWMDPGGWWLRDLGSTHGTFLNGKRLAAWTRRRINAGDVIRFSEAEVGVRGFVVGSAEAWDACGHPPSLLRSLRHVDWAHPDLDRKLWLWAVACLRREGHRHQGGLTNEVGAVLSMIEEVGCDVGYFDQRRESLFLRVQGGGAMQGLRRSLLMLLTPNASFREYCVATAIDDLPDGRDARLVANADLLRCALGNPWRPAVSDPSWLMWHDKAVFRLAQTMERDSAFEEMPILADTLEEAGCSDESLLRHLRGGTHCRSCHALDALLGRPALFG